MVTSYGRNLLFPNLGNHASSRAQTSRVDSAHSNGGPVATFHDLYRGAREIFDFECPTSAYKLVKMSQRWRWLKWCLKSWSMNLLSWNLENHACSRAQTSRVDSTQRIPGPVAAFRDLYRGAAKLFDFWWWSSPIILRRWKIDAKKMKFWWDI